MPWLNYARSAFKPLFNIFLVVMFFLFAVRPFKRWLNQAGEYIATRELQRGDQVPQLDSQAGRDSLASDVKGKILEMNKRRPELSAEVIRTWINEGE